MKSLVIYICFIACLASPAWAQKKSKAKKTSSTQTQGQRPADTLSKRANLVLLVRNYGDSVVLRWAPTEPLFWKAANQAGYVITRYELNKQNVPQRPVVLNSQPIRPWTKEEWKARVSQQDSLAGACVQLLYGKTVDVDLKQQLNLQQAFDQHYDTRNRHSIALFLADRSALHATGLGLRYADRAFQKGKSYLYALHALTDSKMHPSDTTGSFVDTRQIPSKPTLPPIRYEEGDRVVKFAWNRQLSGAHFSGYYYERSADGGKTFQRRNQHPFFQPLPDNEAGAAYIQDIVLTDTLPRNYQRYQYRIVGITPFGDLGEYSAKLPVMGRDKTPPAAPEGLKAENFKSNDVRITWEKRTAEPDLAGFVIGRGQDMNGPFEPLSLNLLPKSTVSFIDTGAVAWGTNYYVVSAIDTAGNVAASMPAYVLMKDIVAPKKPVGLAGKIDTTGIVRLHWKIGREPDLLGYMVYMANAADHTFSPRSPGLLADTTFTDSLSLQTLNEHVYYRVVAFDKNRNPSVYSDQLELRKPDKVPPIPSVFLDFRVSDTTVGMRWVPSTSHDAVAQLLYRRTRGDSAWTEYARLDKTTSTFTDKKVSRQTWYEYTLVAVDDAGLRSARSFPLNVRVSDSGVRKKINAFAAKTAAEGVQLSWQYPVSEGVRYQLYRSYNGSGLLMYKSLPAANLSFTDKGLLKGKYEYALKAVYPDGGESPLVTTAVTFQ